MTPPKRSDYEHMEPTNYGMTRKFDAERYALALEKYLHWLHGKLFNELDKEEQ